MDKDTLRALGLVSGLGFSIVAAIGLGLGGGYLLDNLLNTKPIFMFVGLLLGFIGAGFLVYQLAIFKRGK